MEERGRLGGEGEGGIGGWDRREGGRGEVREASWEERRKGGIGGRKGLRKGRKEGGWKEGENREREEGARPLVQRH